MIHKFKYNNDFYDNTPVTLIEHYDLLHKIKSLRTDETLLTEEKNRLAFKPDNYALQILEHEKDNFRSKNFVTREHFNVLSGTEEYEYCINSLNILQSFIQHGLKTHLTAQIMLLKNLIADLPPESPHFVLLNEMLFSSKLFKFAADNLPENYGDFNSDDFYDKQLISFKSVVNVCIDKVFEFFEHKNQILNKDIIDFPLLCNEKSMIKAISAILFHLSVRTPENKTIFFQTFEKNNSFIIKFVSEALFPDENIFQFENDFDSIFSNTGLFFARKTIESLNGTISVTKKDFTEITIEIPN